MKFVPTFGFKIKHEGERKRRKERDVGMWSPREWKERMDVGRSHSDIDGGDVVVARAHFGTSMGGQMRESVGD